MKEKQRFWSHPWGYKQSFLIAILIMFVGFITEALTFEYVVKIPSWPYNLLILIVFVAYVLGVYFFIKHPIVKWFSSIPAAISSISVFTFLVLLMGFVPQVRKPGFADLIGLTHVIKSWPYLFCSFFLLLVLGFTTVKKIKVLNLKNVAFFLNHAGLWLIIAAASLGSGDLKKYRMNLIKDRAIFIAVDNWGNKIQMPFALKLLEFNIDEYPPDIGLINPRTAQIYLEQGGRLPEVKKNAVFTLGDWKLEVKEYLISAKNKDSIYVESSSIGAVPVVYIKARNILNEKTKEGWVTPGSFMVDPEFLPLDSLHSVVMTIPRPQRFSSGIRVFRKVKDFYDIELEVNKPQTVFGWKIYQTGYNEELGKWSNLSVIELVKDPWLPAVFIGIFMVLFGSLYLVWIGKSKN